MQHPVRFTVEERHVLSAQDQGHRTVEFRVVFNADTLDKVAAKALPVAVAMASSRSRIGSAITGRSSIVRSQASRILPLACTRSGVLTASVVAGAGVVGQQVAKVVSESQVKDRAIEAARKLVCRANGTLEGPACPKCSKPTVIRTAEDGRIFASCSGHDTTGCDFVAFLDLG